MTAREDYHHVVDNGWRLGALGVQDVAAMCREIDALRSAIDQLAELLAGSPIWGLVPEAYNCTADLIHQEWLIEFTGDMQRILHPLRPEMVAAP